MKRTLHIYLIIAGTLVCLSIGTAYSLQPGHFLASTEIGHIANLISPRDKFSIYTTPGISSEQVDVYWNNGSPDHPKMCRVIHCGRPDAKMPQSYGVNNFSVFYAGKPVLINHRQFKFINWHYHAYTINLSVIKPNTIVAHITAQGPDQDWGESAPK